MFLKLEGFDDHVNQSSTRPIKRSKLRDEIRHFMINIDDLAKYKLLKSVNTLTIGLC